MKLAYTAGTPEVSSLPLGWTGEPSRIFSQIAAIGYEGIELQVRDPSYFKTDSLLTAAGNAGLGIAAISTGPAASVDGLFFTSPDAGIRSASVERMRSMIALAAACGAHVTVGGIRGYLHWAPDSATGMGWFREAVDAVLVEAESVSVPVVVEPQNHYATDFLTTVVETVDFVRSYDSPLLKFECDTYHMALEERSVPAALVTAQLSGRMAHLQVGDSNRRAPGHGHLNWPDIVRTLVSLRYDGWVSVECLQVPDSDTSARDAHRYLSMLIDMEVPPSPARTSAWHK